MGTRIKKQQLYINAELTDIGQKYLASGRLSIEGAAVLDNEIDYRFGEFGDSYDIRSNYVLKMQREQSRRVFYNLDGTTPLPVTNVFSGFRQITANTGSVGVFSATSANPSIDDYIFNREVWVASAETSQGETLGNPTSGGDPNRIESLINIYGDIPEEGVVVVQFFAYSNSGTNFPRLVHPKSPPTLAEPKSSENFPANSAKSSPSSTILLRRDSSFWRALFFSTLLTSGTITISPTSTSESK